MITLETVEEKQEVALQWENTVKLESVCAGKAQEEEEACVPEEIRLRTQSGASLGEGGAGRSGRLQEEVLRMGF